MALGAARGAVVLLLALSLLPACLPANPAPCPLAGGAGMGRGASGALRLRGGRGKGGKGSGGGEGGERPPEMTDEEALEELNGLIHECEERLAPLQRVFAIHGISDNATDEGGDAVEDQELADLREAKETFSQHMPTAYRFARALHTRGRYDEAIVAYSEAEGCEHRGEWNETLAHAYSNHALILQAQKENFTVADDLYHKALEVCPDHIPSLANLARLLDGGNTKTWNSYTSTRYTEDLNPDGAEALYRRVLELEPYHVPTLINYAYFLETTRERYEEAKAMYMTAMEIAPNNTILLRNWAGYLCNVEEPYDPDTMMPVHFNKTCYSFEATDPETTLPIDPEVDRPVDRARAFYNRVMELEPPSINGVDPDTGLPLPEYQYHLMHGLLAPTWAPDVPAHISQEEAAHSIEYLKARLARAQMVMEKSQA